MTQVYLEYNSFIKRSEIGIDGYLIQSTNPLAAYLGQPLQSWVDSIVPLLIQSCNDSEFVIDFYGTGNDYNDLAHSINQYLDTHQNVRVSVNYYQKDHAAIAQAEAEHAQERTYKGFVFASVQVKESAENLDVEMEEFVKGLEDRSFEELWEKKDQCIKMPREIFGHFIELLDPVLQEKEQEEKKAIIERIEKMEYAELSDMKKTVEQSHYSYACIDSLLKEIYKKERQCQKADLEDVISTLDSSVRETLRDMIVSIKGKNYDDDIVQEYLLRVNRKIDQIESTELEELCEKLDEMDIDELVKLRENIQDKQYQERFTLPYTKRITARLELLHINRMESYCENIKEVLRDELNEICEKINIEDCRPELKQRFYTQIGERQEQLDHMELLEMTKNLEDQTLEELEALFDKISTGIFNPKLAPAFLTKVRKPLELAKYVRTKYIIKDIESMTRDEVVDAIASLQECQYPERIAKPVRDQLEEALFMLDMQEMIDGCNDFDQLTLDEIKQKRIELASKDYLPNSIALYQTKLAEREMSIGLELVSQLSSFAKQSLDQAGLSLMNIQTAVFSPGYTSCLYTYEQMAGKIDYEELPILIIPDWGFFAITKTNILFQSANGYLKVLRNDFRTIVMEKKIISGTLSVSLNDGTVVPVHVSNKKNMEQIANYVNFFLQNISNEETATMYAPYKTPVAPFAKEKYEVISDFAEVSEESIALLLLNEYRSLEGYAGNISSIRHGFMDNWQALDAKVRTGFGIFMESRIHMYYDHSLFGGAKEGFAIGTDFFHIKKNGQALISISYDDIYEIRNVSGQVQVVTDTNQMIPLEVKFASEEIKNSMARMWNDYVLGMQLLHSVNPVKMVSKLFCTACGEELREDDVFCIKCGKRVE